jgi:predicted Zn-dependent protease
LLGQDRNEVVLQIVGQKLGQQRDDWELLYREGVAWINSGKYEEAKHSFEQLLALKLPIESMSHAAEARFKQAQNKAKSDEAKGLAVVKMERPGPFEIASQSYEVRNVVIPNADQFFNPSVSPTRSVWAPSNYGLARMAGFGWLMRRERLAGQSNVDANEEDVRSEIERQVQDAASKPDASMSALYDWFFLATLLEKQDELRSLARRFAEAGGKRERDYYMSTLYTRIQNKQARQQQNQNAVEPLSDDELAFVIKCYEASKKGNQGQEEAPAGNVIVSGGRVYVRVGNSYRLIGSGTANYVGVVANELRLAGKTDEAAALIKKEIEAARTVSQLGAAMTLSLDEGLLDLVPERFDQWYTAAIKDIKARPVVAGNNMLRGTSNSPGMSVAMIGETTTRWLGKLAIAEENQQILAILDKFLDVAREEVKYELAVDALKKTKPNYVDTQMQSQWYFGDQSQYIQTTTPLGMSPVEMQKLSMIRVVYEILNRNGVPEDLVPMLKKRMEGSSGQDRVVELMNLAVVKWWSEDKEEAVELILSAVDQMPSREKVAIQVAELLNKVADYDRALEYLDKVNARDQRTMLQREMLALNVAERAGDIDRAQKAAERLFGLRLNAQQQSELLVSLQRLGRPDLADAILARVERTAGNQVSSLGSLMSLYAAQGRTDEANQIALQILQRTSTPMVSPASLVRMGRSYANSNDSAERSRAILTLQQSRQLDAVIEKIEKQLAENPESQKLSEQLVEFYEVSGKTDKAIELIKKVSQLRPKVVSWKYKLAQIYRQTGKMDEACTLYLDIIQLSPAMLNNEFYELRSMFRGAKRTGELTKALLAADFQGLRQYYYIVDMANDMLRENPSSTEAIDLIEKCLREYKQEKEYILGNIRSPEAWKNDKFFNIAIQTLIPTPTQAKLDPWFGLKQIRSYSSGGRVDSTMSTVMTTLAGTDKLPKMQEKIDDVVKAAPQWIAGKFITAVLATKTGHEKEGIEQIKALMKDDSIIEAMTPTTCWIVGQDVVKIPELREQARKLLEKAKDDQSMRSNGIEYSPIVLLVDAYHAENEREKIRELLLGYTKKSSNDDPYNREYYNYRHMESLIFIVNQLNRLGMAEDTAAVCMEALMQKDAMAAANQYSGRSTSYASQFQALFNSALDSLSSQDPKILVSRLVGGEGSKNPIFNLSVSANTIPVVSPDVAGARPTVNQANQPPELRNEFLIFIKTMSDKPGFSSVLKERLQELFVQHPDDFSVNVVCAYIDLLQRSDSAKASTQRVLDFLNAHPLEEIPEGRRANSRQRKEAADRIVVWLLAKEMMGTSQWDSQGEVLAKHALQAAKRQSGYSETETITNEWASLAIKANNKTRAENLWQELLKSTAIRPVSKSSKEAGSQSSKLPPLTQSQFKIVTDIAQNAAKNGMPQLSMLAMRESLKGGMPVADVAPANANGASLQAYTVVSSGSRSGAPTAPQISNEQAAVQVMNVLKIWDQNTYDVQETLDLLQSFVFPVSLKQEIYLYGSNAALANAKSESLGRMLMEWAAAAGKTDEVLKQAEERAKSPDTKLTYMALKTFSALNLKNLPEAKTNLQLIVQSLAAANTEAAANTALHAALPATSEPELKTEAFQIIEKAVLFRLKQISMTNRSADAPKDELTTMYQKYLLANEGLEKIKEYFENRLLVSQQYANRYSGEYAIYLQKQDLANAAVELANAGKLDLSMDYLGRSANVILVERYGDTSNASFSVILQSRKLPIDKQYQLWKDWTMPTAQRQSIRFTSAAIPAQHTPKVFQKEDWNHEELKQYSIWSNFHELVRAAKATSQLEETKQLADKALAEGQAAARVLSLMCAIELKQPDLDQQLSTYFEDTNKALTDTNTQNRQTDNKGVGSVLLQCLRESSYFSDSIDRMEKYDRFERERNLSAFRSQALLGFLDSFSMKKNHKPFEAVDNRLAHWITGLLTTPNYTNKPAWWFVERDNLRKLGGGSTTEGLIFAYPVAGEFEFVADCFEGGWGECDIGFNGAMPRPLYYQSPIPIETLSQQERLQRKPALKNSRPGYDQQRIVSDGKTVKFYFNNYLFYQEPISPTSPWVMLHSTGYNLSNFRNMRFTKKPQILNEVNLIGEKMLDGWGSSMFGESLPAERIRAEKIEDRNSYAYHQQNQLANGTDYYIRKDEMIADAKDGMEKQQGWIYYQRSMRPQDTFAYEFFYEPGKFQAWPTFGPLVLLLDSNKEVRSHWISSNATLDQSDFDFSVVEQGCQKVTNLPFKDKDWNKLELSKSDQTIQVKLNGELIFERPFNDIHDHRFGIFHYRNKSLRVRNAKLTGNWPKEMSDELNSNLIAVTKEFSNEERFVIDALPLTTIYEPIASDVVKQARSIGDEKAYPMLLDWVVPDENQARFKMYFQLLSLAEQDKLAQGTIELERVLSPAVELVAVAKRQGKLDELYQRVSAVETYSARDVRAKIGLATLIDIEQNKFDDAKSKLKKLLEIAQTPLPKEYGDGDRAAEWYVILFAGRKPELWDDAWALANKLRETERAEESKANEGNWRPLLHGAMGALTRWKKERSGQTEPVLKQWTSVPSTTARQSAEGLRPSVWRMDSGVLKHDAGETWSHLFFQSPLRGKYEITARRSTFDYAEMLIATGTYSAEPAYDLKSRRLNRTLFFSQPAGEEIKIPNWDKMADFRMVVDGNKVTTYTNGVEVYQQQFNGPIDPWLVLQQDNPWYFGTIENLEIRGTPEIPAEIDLTSLANGGGWLANTYTEGANYSNPVGSGYQFTDQQIVGTLHNDTSSEYVESLLKYYRPMLEDGEIEFEFFYEAGMFEVHPVIGDNALLLGAGEVALHPMSDGPFDREGRKSTASQPIADAKSPGLKEKDWNQVLLKLVGDQVQLSVNGQLVATLTINDPANQRFFGLFRYRDKHEMKVRSVKYRGQWPMQLPATESQELALRR